ncbi:universal stress protein [Azospirillum sp. TSO22-1]|uniref:universal stress protein n=1 Tax=Azospirillum sp. TSO22-1 TaxID=716789 RepID=UPI000D60BADE|nr:universal stress protein [Azospirillum sp. TSO22-1]PWC44801.1 universal stress protein UspA [Azospirillum sp. TSO22-1]
MSIKSILVPVAGSESDPVALSAAIAVARLFDAHVDSLFVKLDPRDAVPMLGEGMSGAMVDEIMRAAENESDSHLTAARRHFEAVLHREQVDLREGPSAVGGVSARWREVVGRAEEVVALEGRFADLLVFAHTEIDRDAQAYATLETALLSAARPLLLAPQAGLGRIGKSIALAWNGSAESARAVAGAMPFLRRADTVYVLTAETSSTQAATGRRIAEYLAWHDVNCQLTIVKPGSEPVGHMLTSKTAELGADLLVMGGYGHSRMRELILGGVTRYVLGHAGLPVLMAH